MYSIHCDINRTLSKAASVLCLGEQLAHDLGHLDSIADGLKAEGTGEHTFPIISKFLEKDVFSVVRHLYCEKPVTFGPLRLFYLDNERCVIAMSWKETS